EQRHEPHFAQHLAGKPALPVAGVADQFLHRPLADRRDQHTGRFQLAKQRLRLRRRRRRDRKSTRLNSSHGSISYAVFCLKKKKKTHVVSSFIKKKKKRK